MAYRIPDTQNLAPTDLSDSSDGLESDDGASDWGTDDGEAFITKSLFDASTHPTASQAIQHDEEKYGINVKNVISSLELDFYGSMRLINLVRQEVRLGPRKQGLMSVFETGVCQGARSERPETTG